MSRSEQPCHQDPGFRTQVCPSKRSPSYSPSTQEEAGSACCDPGESANGTSGCTPDHAPATPPAVDAMASFTDVPVRIWSVKPAPINVVAVPALAQSGIPNRFARAPAPGSARPAAEARVQRELARVERGGPSRWGGFWAAAAEPLSAAGQVLGAAAAIKSLLGPW